MIIRKPRDLGMDKVINLVNNLDEVQTAFNNLSNSPTALKSLIKVGD